jgi:AcrR family transcriptional regulator
MYILFAKQMRLNTTVRREQIVSAVQEILAADGIPGVSAARVAQRVGFVPSALYRHFPSLEAMIFAAVDDIRGRVQLYTRDCVTAGHSPLETMRMLLEYAAGLLPLIQILPRVFLGATSCDPVFANYVAGIQNQHMEFLSGLVRQAQGAGQIRKDYPAESIALMYWGITMQSFLRWMATRGEFDAVAHTRTVWGLFLDMVNPELEPAPKRPAGRTRRKP